MLIREMFPWLAAFVAFCWIYSSAVDTVHERRTGWTVVELQQLADRQACDTDTDCMLKLGGDGGPGINW